MNRLTRVFVMTSTGLALLVLSACAGHKELKAPCSLSGSMFSASAFAADCGPLRLLNQ